VEFRILGPLEAVAADRVITVAAPKQRALLAVLVVCANQLVTTDRLVDELWAEHPPSSATNLVQGYVSRLRRLLGTDSCASREVVLSTRASGYELQVEPGDRDVEAFQGLLERGRSTAAQGAGTEAATLLQRALELWRGAALADVPPTPTVAAEAARLEELRLGALEDRIELEIAAGRHAGLVAELIALVAAEPLRERLRGQLMLALYRSGRQAEALEAFREGRQVLVEQLGIEPGAELRRLEAAILAADPLLAAGRSGPAVPIGWSRWGRPSQLPADTADFTGRHTAAARVRDQLVGTGRGGRPAAVAVSAVAGKAGVGKTSLAVHVAHQVREAFPDGQLYVNLNGIRSHPADPAAVLARFLRALGVDPSVIPAGLDERSELYRERLAGRRVLVVLDDAAGEAQVRPLLPGSPSCAVLVTSRRGLTGLEGADVLDLDVLRPEQAVELLGRIAGAHRVANEPAAAEAITRACGWLPLALRIAGARLRARPDWALARLAERLADERHRLDELSLGDHDVRASLTLSYQALDERQRRGFARLGLLEAPDMAAWVVAALLDLPDEDPEGLVEPLVEARLLEVAGTDHAGQPRYRLHDLVRLYARERAEIEDPEPDRRAALRRALAAWLWLAERADQRLAGGVPAAGHGGGRCWPLPTALAERLLADPGGWFDAELAALVAAVQQAHAAGFDELAWDLAGSLSSFLDLRHRVEEWELTHRLGLDAARRAGDRLGQAVVLCGLGDLHYRQDQHEQALARFQEALALYEGLGEGRGQVHALYGIAYSRVVQGRYPEALAGFQRALRLLAVLDDQQGIAYGWFGVGAVHRDQGRLDQAEACFQEALAAARRADAPRITAWTLRGLGDLYGAQGKLDLAEQHLAQALGMSGGLGDRLSEAFLSHSLGRVYLLQGRHQAAGVALGQGLQAFRTLGHRYGEARALQALGQLHQAEGRHAEATACLEHAVGAWRALGSPLRLARALGALVTVYTTSGNHAAAQAARAEALALFQQIGAPEAI
jgi:DNA-binding SARP family transcriptional activator/tetratricopeptide (TPR) repeat protein